MTRRLIGFVLLALTLALRLAPAAAEQKTLVILHTNDIHGHILPSIDFDYAGEPKPLVGGMARLSGVVRAVREEAAKAGKGFLLLDAGDIFDGTPEGLETKGRGIVELMNLLAYDAMTVGNHEFAHGVGPLQELAKAAKFPFLACNLVREEGGAPADFCVPFIVKETAGLKVAVIGVTTATTPEMNFPEATAGVRFLDTGKQVGLFLERVRKEQSPDLTIVLSHIGSQADAALARELPSLTLILGGHDHVTLDAGMRRGNALICQTGDHCLRVGRVDLTYDTETKAIVKLEARLVNLGADGPAADPAVEAKVQELRCKGYDEPVGRCDESCVRSRDQESRVGNLVADAMRAQTGAAVAVMNSGGVRSGLLRGEVTRRELFDIVPFPDPVRVFTLRGAELQALLENGVAPNGGYKFEVSGVRFAINPHAKEGRKIKDLHVGDAAVAADAEYAVAVSRFFAQQGIRKAFFAGKPSVDSPCSVYDCLVKLFQSVPEVKTRAPGAIVTVREKPAEEGEETVNVNQADAITLTHLPGIGDTLAARIVEYREAHGPFQSLDELEKIKGFSAGLLGKLRGRLVLE